MAQRQENLEEQKSILKDAHEDLAKLQKSLQTAQDVAKIFQELEQAKERYRLEIEEGAQEQAEAKVHLKELQFAQGLQETISSLKQYQKQLLQVEHDLEIAQEELKAKEQAFEEVKAQKVALAAQTEDFLQKEEKLEAWKEAIIYAQSLAQEQEKIKRSSANYKQLEETYQQASKEIESLNKSLTDLEANRLSLESLHEAEKLFQSVGYSVDKQLTQALKEIEALNQELEKTEKRHQTLSLDSDQAQEILNELEEKLRTTLASRRQLMIAQLQAELEDGQPCMVCGSLDHPKVDGTQADETALKDLMDQVEELVKDPQVKLIWTVPKYSNPDGIIYSDETIRRFAHLKPAAPDFAIIWDNAYGVHEFEGDYVPFPDILSLCDEAGRPDMVYEFASTSKITFAGGGISCMAASEANICYFTGIFGVQMISYDKVNQLRHVRFLKDKAHTLEIMKLHASVMAPKFECVAKWLNREIRPLGIAHWNDPKGGYFVSLFAMPGTAKRVWTLCKEAGVVLTNAGATYPYRNDPDDSNLRIAPSLPPVAELEEAMEVLCLSLRLAALEKLLAK